MRPGSRRVDGEPVGSALCLADADRAAARLDSLLVDPERGAGLSRRRQALLPFGADLRLRLVEQRVIRNGTVYLRDERIG